ncbi:MAG: hypothetical protein IT319_01175 [Anaerolineae bacterium]|nr:hypothetical protein [Anaerolineae bacterium]
MLKVVSLLCLALLVACTASPTPTAMPTLAILPAATATEPEPASPAPKLIAIHQLSTMTATTASTDTPIPPTATDTPLPPTATETAAPSTATPSPSDTPLPPTTTNTFTPSDTPTPTVTAYPTTAGDASVGSTSSQLVELRAGPGFDFDMAQVLASGEPLFLIGRSWDSQWYQVRRMTGQEGWVYALYLVVWIDPNRLVVTWQQPTQPPVVTVGSFALGGHIMGTTSDAFVLARRAGMTWVKVQWRYYVGQSAAEVAGEIQTAHQNGFRILLGVVGDRAQMGNFDSYIASYAAFVADVAALGADAIEIWNEPNIDREWLTGMIYGAYYTQLLAASYTAIKARVPGTIVISAAPAPTGFFGGDGCDTGGCNDDIFLKQMAAAGAQNYLDCVGLHHNDGIVSPLASSGDPRGSHPTYYLTGVISRVPPEFNSKPLCFTELGYLSPEGYGGLPGNFAWAQQTTVAEQAEWLADALRIARSTGRVEMMIVWNLDFDVYTANDPMAGYAIKRPGGGCPACDSLAAAAR